VVGVVEEGGSAKSLWRLEKVETEERWMRNEERCLGAGGVI
jgi:hypothetical protein